MSSISHAEPAAAGKLQKSKTNQLSVNFTPRLSTLDRHNQSLHQNPLRGLYALFWILLGFHIIATIHASGSLAIQSPLARLFSKHLPQLTIVDLCLVTSTFSALGFAKRMPWIQSGFLTLHSITMLMKIHSYCATNGEYSEKFKKLESKLSNLKVTSIKAYDRDHRSSILHLIDNVIRLIVPFTINYLLIFYIIFECICNAFAELTRFADREFYSDWWNSCSFDEFSRKVSPTVSKINQIESHKLTRQISSYGISRSAAAFMTLFLSSLVHELLMVIVTRKLRLYLFIAQMTQLPLTYIGRSKILKSRPALANNYKFVKESIDVDHRSGGAPEDLPGPQAVKHHNVTRNTARTYHTQHDG
ncbi:hypothetical protein H4Q26_009816 [Puccinia striiformis f. sp. tritici PST-130]|nr:hypothetical protein H4Q26_009816 [Puccinia striiformis f. sp. tritici PST-130]